MLSIFAGVKINDVAVLDAGGFDKAKIASLAIEAYLIQVGAMWSLIQFSVTVLQFFIP